MGHESTDERADAELFASMYPALRRFAAVVAPLDLDPDDLVQEAVARTLRAGPLARLDHPMAYLRRTIVHVASNHNRTRGRERRANQRASDEEPGVHTNTYPSDLSELDQLSTTDRAALFLADIERLPLDQVAEILGTNGPAARARVARARRRLKQTLSSGGPT